MSLNWYWLFILLLFCLLCKDIIKVSSDTENNSWQHQNCLVICAELLNASRCYLISCSIMQSITKSMLNIATVLLMPVPRMASPAVSTINMWLWNLSQPRYKYASSFPNTFTDLPETMSKMTLIRLKAAHHIKMHNGYYGACVSWKWGWFSMLTKFSLLFWCLETTYCTVALFFLLVMLYFQNLFNYFFSKSIALFHVFSLIIQLH